MSNIEDHSHGYLRGINTDNTLHETGAHGSTDEIPINDQAITRMQKVVPLLSSLS